MKVMIMIADGCGGNGNDGSGDDGTVFSGR